MATRFLSPYPTFLDGNGNPLVGGYLYFWETGSSTTPADTYSDVTLSTANANPIELNSRGEPAVNIFLDPSVTYRAELRDADGVSIWTADNVTDAGGATAGGRVSVYPGNPNGNVAGTEGTFGGEPSSMVYDSINDILYICTASGGVSDAEWTAQTGGAAVLNTSNTFLAGQTIQITEAGAEAGPFLTFDWESASPADNDTATVIRGMGEDDEGGDQVYVTQKFKIIDATAATACGGWIWGVASDNVDTDVMMLDDSALYPAANNLIGLGTTSVRWRHLYLDTSGYIDFGNGNAIIFRDNSNNELLFINDNVYAFSNQIRVALSTASGTLADFRTGATNAAGGSSKGTISVNGETVTYGTFCGSHWSQLAGSERADIPAGTIMETIDELCVWPGEENTILPRTQVAQRAAGRNVYGVFFAWDDNVEIPNKKGKRKQKPVPVNPTNDFFVAALGAFKIRVKKGQKPKLGDLLESAGGGTARVQKSGAFTASTIAKVTGVTPIEVYDDGSYTVPCTLHCG